MSAVSLSGYVETYLSERWTVTPAYAAHVRGAVRKYLEWPGAQDDLANMPATLPAYLASLLAMGKKAPSTVNDKRALLLAIIRAAADEGLCPMPRRIRKVVEPHDPPTAWSTAQISELLWTAQHWPGKVGAVPAGLWWDSLFSTVYWTSCRIGALLQTPKDAYHEGTLLVRGRTQKTSKGQLHRLPEHCTAKLDKLVEFPGPLLWPWPHTPTFIFRVARNIIERAGLPCPKGGRNLFHKIRRTCISYLWSVDPAAAQRQAGHASAATTKTHYVSPEIAKEPSACELLPSPSY